MDKVYALSNLRAAFAKVKANGGAAGVDLQTVEMYERRLEENLGKLAQALKEGKYHPQAVKRVWIPKLGKNTFPRLDGWVRMRIRSILRKRLGLRGRGRGSDHQRWPNAFFGERGLFSFRIFRQDLLHRFQRPWCPAHQFQGSFGHPAAAAWRPSSPHGFPLLQNAENIARIGDGHIQLQ